MTDWRNSSPAYYFQPNATPYGPPGRRRTSTAEMSAQIGRALARAGASAVRGADDRRTAIHEGGHCWVLYRLGHQLDEVRLDEPGRGGETEHSADLDPDGRALALLAGALAERAILGEVGDGSDDDAEQLAAVLPLADADVVGRASALVAEGRAAIVALADVLMARRRMSGTDVAAVLAEHSRAVTGRRAASTAGRGEFRAFGDAAAHEQLLRDVCRLVPGATRAQAQRAFDEVCRRRLSTCDRSFGARMAVR